MSEIIGSPDAIKENNYGIFEVQASNAEISNYLNDTLDLREFQDYVFITNQSISDPDKRYPKMIHFVSRRGFERFLQSGVHNANRAGITIVRKWLIPDLNDSGYELWNEKSLFSSKKAQMPMTMTHMGKLGSLGSGWHKEPVSHSYASKFGKAPAKVRGR